VGRCSLERLKQRECKKRCKTKDRGSRGGPKPQAARGKPSAVKQVKQIALGFLPPGFPAGAAGMGGIQIGNSAKSAWK
jgi:hypothetical protein